MNNVVNFIYPPRPAMFAGWRCLGGLASGTGLAKEGDVNGRKERQRRRPFVADGKLILEGDHHKSALH